MARHGQGISINVIVIAAIALLVLVILSVLVIRANNKLQIGVECGGRPNEACRSQVDGCFAERGETIDPTLACKDKFGEKQVCCVVR